MKNYTVKMDVASVCCALVLLITFCKADDCEEFPALEEEEYSLEYAKITESAARPLGFKKYVARFGGARTCVSITGAAGRGVEILIETSPPAALCFSDQTDETCLQGSIITCRAAVTDKMSYSFYIDRGADGSESDVAFWLRITKGRENDADLEWCHDRDSRLPSSLIDIPVGLSPPPPAAPDRPTGAAPPPPAGPRTLVILISVLLCAIQKYL